MRLPACALRRLCGCTEYFKAAAERGNADAQFNLGAMYVGGLGVRKAYDKALHHFTLSAHQGHTLALYNLGQMHLSGLGAPRSCPVGAQFLKAVAERGPWGSLLEEAHAALQSGDAAVPLQIYAVLAEGQCRAPRRNRFSASVVPAPLPCSPSCLVHACAALFNACHQRQCTAAPAHGTATAHRSCKRHPRSVPPRSPRRREKLTAARVRRYALVVAGVAGGFELAQYNVAFLLDQQYMHDASTPLLGLSDERLAERARGMYKMAALQGNVEAELKLGDYAYWGMGMEVDMEASVAHYRAATDARSAQAMFNLAYMYAHGLGLTRDCTRITRAPRTPAGLARRSHAARTPHSPYD